MTREREPWFAASESSAPVGEDAVSGTALLPMGEPERGSVI